MVSLASCNTLSRLTLLGRERGSCIYVPHGCFTTPTSALLELPSLVNMSSASNSNILFARSPGLEIEEGLLEDDLAFSSNLRPPLLVKLTVYRLLAISIIASFGTAKAVKSLEGGTVTVTWLDWIVGVIFGTILYWLGLYENLQPPVAVWFFHTDLALDLFYLLFGIVIASIYVVFCLLCFTPLCRLSFVAWVHMFPNKQDPGLWLSMLYLPLIVMLTLSLLAATYFLPLLASAVIISVILTLGGRRFERKATNFFVTGYLSRFFAHTVVYCIATVLSTFVIFSVFLVNIPLEQWMFP